MPGTTLIDRALIRVSGPDARDFLQGLVTNDVAAVAPDRPRWAGLLTAQGKVLFDFILWDGGGGGDGDGGGGGVLIDCEREAAGDLARRLTLYRLRRPIQIAREEVLCAHWSPEGGAGPDDPRLAALGRRWLAPAGEESGADASWREHRLRLGVAEGRAELGEDKILWLECNARELHGVDFGKGCYVGQENTARMNWRNKVNRRLVVVPADAPGPRARIHYPELGLSVEHRRVDDLDGALIPDWLAAAIA